MRSLKQLYGKMLITGLVVLMASAFITTTLDQHFRCMIPKCPICLEKMSLVGTADFKSSVVMFYPVERSHQSFERSGHPAAPISLAIQNRAPPVTS